MFIVTMGILKMPYAMLMGVVIAITALIPVFGAFIGCFIGIIMIGIVNPIQAIEFIVLFLVLQQIEGNFIYPHVVGNSVGLPSIWVFVAVIIGGNLMGIMGMFLFIPLTSIFYTLFKTYSFKYSNTISSINIVTSLSPSLQMLLYHCVKAYSFFFILIIITFLF